MNTDFEIRKTTLKDAYIVVPFSRDDNRGNFTKDFLKVFFVENGLDADLSETFYARNDRKYTIRGMHFAYKNPQSKLVKCITGEIFDVIVDLRKDSPTYLKWEGFCLSEENNLSLFVPKGFAHGYLTIKPGIVAYKCSGVFDSAYDSGIHYRDKTIGIKWPVDDYKNVIISLKDDSLKSFNEMKDLLEH